MWFLFGNCFGAYQLCSFSWQVDMRHNSQSSSVLQPHFIRTIKLSGKWVGNYEASSQNNNSEPDGCKNSRTEVDCQNKKYLLATTLENVQGWRKPQQKNISTRFRLKFGKIIFKCILTTTPRTVIFCGHFLFAEVLVSEWDRNFHCEEKVRFLAINCNSITYIESLKPTEMCNYGTF